MRIIPKRGLPTTVSHAPKGAIIAADNAMASTHRLEDLALVNVALRSPFDSRRDTGGLSIRNWVAYGQADFKRD